MKFWYAALEGAAPAPAVLEELELKFGEVGLAGPDDEDDEDADPDDDGPTIGVGTPAWAWAWNAFIRASKLLGHSSDV